MSETYTIGCTTFQRIGYHERAGQTFEPLETHTISYVDLKLTRLFLPSTLNIEIQETDHGDIPTGVILSSGQMHLPLLPFPVPAALYRVFMSPAVLSKGTTYAIVAYLSEPAVIGAVNLAYNDNFGAYPRGLRLHKGGAEIDWVKHGSDDHYFCEFGTPPLPKPEPEPPIEHFAIPGIYYTHWDIGLTIRITTSVPCHLTLYHTDKKPLKHHTSRIVRGLSVPWRTYFCFVAWQEVEQEEIGDSLYHTFELPDWLEGQKKWFTFRGEVNTISSPSVGPIFEHTHPGGYPRIMITRPDRAGLICSPRFSEIGDPCPDHWKNIDEAIPDEDATCLIGLTINNWYYWELYGTPGFLEELMPVKSIALTGRFRRAGGFAYIHLARNTLRTHATIYHSETYNNFPETYQDRTWILEKNPFTDEFWTLDELNALQIGESLRRYYGVGWTAVGWCTQLYATIERDIKPQR